MQWNCTVSCLMPKKFKLALDALELELQKIVVSCQTWLPGDWIPVLGKQQGLLTIEPSFQSCNCFHVLFWVTKGTQQQDVSSVCSWQLHTSWVFPVWPFMLCFMYATGSPLVICITSFSKVSMGCSTDMHFSGWLEIIIIYEQRWWMDGWMDGGLVWYSYKFIKG